MNTLHIVYLVSGILLFLFIISDIIKTTFTTNGGGPYTNFISRAVWKIFFLLAGKNGRSKILEYAGTAVLIIILLTWVAGLWVGLFLILQSDEGSIVNSDTKLPADALEKLYFAGFTLSTLGVGDFMASNDFWRIVTSIAAFSGLAFITVSITYFVPVLSAVALQAKLSMFISGMGRSPQQILINSWNGKDFSDFFENAPELCQMIYQHTLNHHSYPVIHYFHNNDPKLSITIALVILDETHRILKEDLAEISDKEALKMSMLQTALDKYLQMMRKGYINSTSENTGPTPDLQQLRNKGIPVNINQEKKAELDQKIQKRRKLLSTTLEKDGWSWEEIFTK
ncbi:MAG: potassium channel family protein [Hymenobacteraceae bacterium]|nr:potassium channel family protein [Hymenobacteraceae bacterium]MDX5394662.1 potassium channel family protein [Hymenobacteraceae bacterium]MDX5510693.1 potassium channel family protein [Hymenobacteraceae bacterium]